jgi:peptidoglycan/LPS O-acetylase OafA/YrhL
MNSHTPYTSSIKRIDFIDGLRAIAVISVILFHFSYTGFSGGFVGVDIFFVISGYLITQIILKEASEQKFTLGRFYERRVRRIFPALFAVIFICTVLFPFLFNDDYVSYLGLSITSTSLFTRNFLAFFMNNDLQLMDPLIHGWSLAVEEQFYIFYPLVLYALSKRFSQRTILIIISIITAASFGYAVLIDTTDRLTHTSLYSTFLRVWQLGLGAILSMIKPREIHSKDIREIISLLGLCFILIAVVGFDTSSSHIRVSHSIIPCMGVIMIIYSGLYQQTMTTRLLSQKHIVRIGLISYSLYLWHWPLYILAERLSWSFEDIDFNMVIKPSFLLLSFAISYLSWLFIEEPIRTKALIKERKSVFLLALVMIMVFSSAGLSIYFLHR